MINHRGRKFLRCSQRTICIQIYLYDLCYAEERADRDPCYLTCCLTAARPPGQQQQQASGVRDYSFLHLFSRFMFAVEVLRIYWIALIARNTRVSLESLRDPREVRRATSAPPRGTNKTDGRKLQDSMSHPPVRRLTHMSRNYSSIYLAKVEVPVSRLLWEKVAIALLLCLSLGLTECRSRSVTLLENMCKTIWRDEEVLRDILQGDERVR